MPPSRRSPSLVPYLRVLSRLLLISILTCSSPTTANEAPTAPPIGHGGPVSAGLATIVLSEVGLEALGGALAAALVRGGHVGAVRVMGDRETGRHRRRHMQGLPRLSYMHADLSSWEDMAQAMTMTSPEEEEEGGAAVFVLTRAGAGGRAAGLEAMVAVCRAMSAKEEGRRQPIVVLSVGGEARVVGVAEAFGLRAMALQLPAERRPGEQQEEEGGRWLSMQAAATELAGWWAGVRQSPELQGRHVAGGLAEEAHRRLVVRAAFGRHSCLEVPPPEGSSKDDEEGRGVVMMGQQQQQQQVGVEEHDDPLLDMEVVVARGRGEALDWLQQWGLGQGTRVVVYDKRDWNASHSLGYNLGDEASVYLHHIIKHYWSLPSVVLFLQGDPLPHVDKSPGHAACVLQQARRTRPSYLSMNPSIHLEGAAYSNNPEVDAVAHAMLSPIGEAAMAALARERRYFFPGANFVTTGEAVRRQSLDTWQRLHAMTTDKAGFGQGAYGTNLTAGAVLKLAGYALERWWHLLLQPSDPHTCMLEWQFMHSSMVYDDQAPCSLVPSQAIHNACLAGRRRAEGSAAM